MYVAGNMRFSLSVSLEYCVLCLFCKSGKRMNITVFCLVVSHSFSLFSHIHRFTGTHSNCASKPLCFIMVVLLE